MKRVILAAMVAAGLADETLTFFGIKPNIVVAELAPGAGWYSDRITQKFVTQLSKRI